VSGEGPKLEAGRVGRPHGLDGSFYVTGPLPRLLRLGTSVELGARSTQIVRRAGTEQRPIVRLEGVEDRAAAEALRGERLMVATEQAPQLGEGEFWAHELEGCEVLAGRHTLGKVKRLLELPSCEALEVERGEHGAHAAHGSEPLLVPLVRDAIRGIDIAAKRIEVDPGFLDLQPPEATPGVEQQAPSSQEARDGA
jgi:16S rRNA processing protein RimM